MTTRHSVVLKGTYNLMFKIENTSLAPINNQLQDTYNYKIELLEVLQMPEYELQFDESLSNSKSLRPENFLQFSIPDGKLFYPEPFIASPSYLHSDLTFLHIFQY